MNITENNKLIDDFMGSLGSWHSITDGWAEVNGYYKPRYYNWNLLMEVVEKIESLSYSRGRKYYLFMEQSYVQIRIDRMNYKPFGKWGTSSNKDKLKAVYNSCVEFIKMYNEQKK